MEPRFGHDFSRVRVHTGARAEESAREVGALAYTVGEHVVFGATRYSPVMTEGRRLLAHELSHVMQQRATSTAAVLQRAVSPKTPTIRKKLAVKNPSEKDTHDVLLILKQLATQDLQDTLGAMGEKLVERFLTHLGKADLDQEFSTIRWIKNNWPRTVTTTSGATTVTTTVIGSCSAKQYQQISNAALLGLQWLDRAIARTDAYLAKPGDTATQDVRAAFELHFHNTTDRVAHHVRERLAHIRNDIRDAVPFSVECHGSWDKGCDVANAYATSNQVVFCYSFFNGSGITQAETVVHEMAHAQVGGTHITDRGYESERVLRYLSTVEALTNAESYGLFVQQLGTGKVPSMPAPTDRPEDCPKDWWDLIRLSISRAQRWNRNAHVVTNWLTPGQVKNWDAQRQNMLGGTGQAAIDAANKAYKLMERRLGSRIEFECEPWGGGRCSETGVQTYWFAIWSDFHICPAWRHQKTDDDRIVGLLAGLYGYLTGVDDNARRWNYARLARELTTGGWAVPKLGEVLGSTLWRSDRLRITITPIEPKTPGQESFIENGTTPHPRMSDRLPVYQVGSGMTAELPFRCRFEFYVDEADMPRPAPFTPPRVSATLNFHDVSGKFQQIFPTEDSRPVYQVAGQPLSTAGSDSLEMLFNRNGQLAITARLEDPDTHMTRVYNDLIQIQADRSAERPPAPPQTPKVEGCTGWEKNPEGFVKYIATYVAVNEINPVIDTRVQLVGCKDPHECNVAFPNGLNMTLIWEISNRRIMAKWEDQGAIQRHVYTYSCAIGRVTLTPFAASSTPAPATPSKGSVK
jgi:Domain of unknown function (DUF4157)/Lysine-specific metallo-endopeptidase